MSTREPTTGVIPGHVGEQRPGRHHVGDAQRNAHSRSLAVLPRCPDRATPYPGSVNERPDPPALPHRQLALVLVGLMLGVLLSALDGTIVAVALPTISGHLGHVENAHWVVTAYLMTATAATLLYGRASDVFGRKPVFLSRDRAVPARFGAVLVGAGDGGQSSRRPEPLQGVGGGGLLSLVSLATVADLVPARKRAAYQGMFGAVFGLAGVLGPLIGGVIVTYASWRWLFLINLPVGAVVLALVARTLPATPRRPGAHLDPFGAVLLVGAVGFFLCWTSRGQETGYGGAGTTSLIVVAVLLAIGFLVIQRTTASPVLPLRLFRSRGFTAVTLVAFCGGVSLFAAILFVPLFLQLRPAPQRHHGRRDVGRDDRRAGDLLDGGRARGQSQRTSALNPWCSARWRSRSPSACSPNLDEGTSAGATIAVLVLLGLGLGAVSPMMVTVAQSSVAREDLGVATSAVSFFPQPSAAPSGQRSGSRCSPMYSGAGPGEESSTRPGCGCCPTGSRRCRLATRSAFLDAFTDAASTVFWLALPVAGGRGAGRHRHPAPTA